VFDYEWYVDKSIRTVTITWLYVLHRQVNKDSYNRLTMSGTDRQVNKDSYNRLTEWYT
jgi:hypothetical protein